MYWGYGWKIDTEGEETICHIRWFDNVHEAQQSLLGERKEDQLDNTALQTKPKANPK